MGARTDRALVVLAAVLTAACSGPSSATPAPTAEHSSVAGLSPAARVGFGFAYDAARRVTVLFGGRGQNDTWTWTGKSWIQQHPSRSPNAQLSLGYDAKRRQIVGFGTGEALTENVSKLPAGETWIWDGKTWSQPHPATEPPARSAATLVWDSKRGRLIMHGGDGRPNEKLNDTWAWDGSNWQWLAQNPTDVSNLPGELAYYPTNDTVVMYYFYSGSASDPNQRFMWSFDGVSWSRGLAGTAALPLRGQIVYDQRLNKLVLFGQDLDLAGYGSEGGAATWLWDGRSWSRVPTQTGPPSRFYPRMVYDSARQVEVLFGGYVLGDGPVQQNDVWEFDGRSWTRVQA